MGANAAKGTPTSVWISEEETERAPKAQVDAVLTSLGRTIVRVCPENVLYVSAEINIGSEERIQRFLSENPSIHLVWLEEKKSHRLLSFCQEYSYFLSKLNDPTLAVTLFNEIVDYSSYVEYGVFNVDWSDTMLFTLNPRYSLSFSSYNYFLQQRDHFFYGMDCAVTWDTGHCSEWMGYGADVPEELKNILNNRRNLTFEGVS